MHLEDRMIQSPPNCMVCGAGNTPDGESGEIGPFLDLERDVNWGDSTYLCQMCSTQIGAMFGMMTPDDRKDLERQLKAKDKAIHELKAEIDIRSRREREAVKRARAMEVVTS